MSSLKDRWVPLLAGLLMLAAPGRIRSADSSGWKLPVETSELKPGGGRAVVLGQCLLCHSADYITTQPPMTAAAWEASVNKMRSRFGAPIPTNVVPVLVEYLATAYGPTGTGRPAD